MTASVTIFNMSQTNLNLKVNHFTVPDGHPVSSLQGAGFLVTKYQTAKVTQEISTPGTELVVKVANSGPDEVLVNGQRVVVGADCDVALASDGIVEVALA